MFCLQELGIASEKLCGDDGSRSVPQQQGPSEIEMARIFTQGRTRWCVMNGEEWMLVGNGSESSKPFTLVSLAFGPRDPRWQPVSLADGTAAALRLART